MSTITGYFTKVEIPEVRAGDEIKATIGFYALNPGAYYWKTFLVVDSPQLGLRKVLDAAREIGQEGGRTKTYTLGRMPDGDVNISLFLFAHDDAAYNWSWPMYEYWTRGLSVGFTHLDSHYIFLSPTEPTPPPEPEPPGEVVLSGVITRVEPKEFARGKPIDLKINFNAYCESLYYQIRGWETRLVAEVNGLKDSDSQWHYGRDGSRTGETLNLGAMPDRNLSGTLTLQGRGAAIPTSPWQLLDEQNLVIKVTEAPRVYTCPYCGDTFSTKEELYAHVDLEHPEMPPPEPEPEPEPKPPIPNWLIPALIAAAAALLLVPAKKGK